MWHEYFRFYNFSSCFLIPPPQSDILSFQLNILWAGVVKKEFSICMKQHTELAMSGCHSRRDRQQRIFRIIPESIKRYCPRQLLCFNFKHPQNVCYACNWTMKVFTYKTCSYTWLYLCFLLYKFQEYLLQIISVFTFWYSK
jgi:hypothetical protein